MATVRLGVIGNGFRIARLIERMTQLDPAVSLHAVADPDPRAVAAARRVNPQVRLCDDEQALAADPAVDWVVIGSPNHLHVQHALPCLAAGKHVICEKPVATTLGDALTLRDAARAADRVLAVGFTMRYAALQRKAFAALREGRIGTPISLEFNEVLGFNHGGMIHGSWRRHAAMAGSHLLEKCCHDIDCVNWMLGSRARRVASFGGCNFFTPRFADQVDRVGPGADGKPAFMSDPRTTDNPFLADKSIVDNQVIILEYQNDVRATFHLNCCAAIPERRLYICGSEGTLRADHTVGRLEWQRIGWDEPRTLWPDTRSEGGHGGADETLCREWIAMMRHGHAPAASIGEGVDAAVTCFAIDDAAEAGQVIDLTPYWDRVDATPAAAQG